MLAGDRIQGINKAWPNENPPLWRKVDYYF